MTRSNNSQNVVNFVKRRKNNLIKVFGSKCCICGFNNFQEGLDFHHVNPEEKEFGLTSESTTKALDKQLKEAKKCILVCANCHRGIHYGYIQVPENWQSFYNENIAQSLLDDLEKVKTHQINYCKRCGIEISYGAKYCPECSHLISRKVERPSREELKQMIRTEPFTTIAKKYGVTDNSIRKWCEIENLPTKKRLINNISDSEWEKI